jgi:uncharacterized paraquat-inducible protein A
MGIWSHTILKARGVGIGSGGPRQGDGGADICRCPKCSYSEPHTRGTPCSKKVCPKCGSPMVGANKE